MRKIIEASTAAAVGVKLSRPKVIPMYPITPQTHIVERLAEFINDGELDADMIHVESEHSAISAAIGSQATGVRTFTATASQGLALMHEVLHIVSGMRLPVVMEVANRALSAPINIWNDHQDSISARDTGWIQLYVESAQEALDTVIQAFKIAEDKKVLLPAMVCLDGFTLTHVFEPVDVPSQVNVDKFLPKYKPAFCLDTKKPITMGPIAYPNSFMEFKEAEQIAMNNALKVIKETNTQFKNQFGRGYGDGLIETYRIKDAQYAVVCMGTIVGTSRVVVDKLRKQGKKVGLIKLKSFRPFPIEEILKVTKGLKAIAVADRNISLGQEGALFSEIRSALYGKSKIIVSGFIAGLGGRDVKEETIERMFDNINHGGTTWLK